VAGEQWRVCAGSALRFGTEDGSAADTAFALGETTVGGSGTSGSSPGEERLEDPGAELELLAQGPLVLRDAAGSAPVGAQAQALPESGVTGLAAASCVEPGGSAWLVGGATTVGRTTLLEFVNPSDVDAMVSLRIWGEDGPVSAAGISGISVPASSRRVVSLAAYAPGLVSPVIEVTTRGGRVAAFLQQSIVRGLDSGGTALVTPSADPDVLAVIPGVRIRGDGHRVDPVRKGRVELREYPGGERELHDLSRRELDDEARALAPLPLRRREHDSRVCGGIGREQAQDRLGILPAGSRRGRRHDRRPEDAHPGNDG
jgi:hypothetical protein